MGYYIGPADKMKYPWVQAAADFLGAKFGIKTIGGYRPSDPYPDHPGGKALDLMTYDGGPLAEYAAANADALGVDYIIWNRRSWNSKRRAWAPYTGSNPHTDHVHITFHTKPPTGGGLTNLTNTVGQAATSAVGWTFDVDKAAKRAEGATLTVVAAVLGVSLIGAGILYAIKPRLMNHLGG
jgi:hypothetical protein